MLKTYISAESKLVPFDLQAMSLYNEETSP